MCWKRWCEKLHHSREYGLLSVEFFTFTFMILKILKTYLNSYEDWTYCHICLHKNLQNDKVIIDEDT